MDLIKKLKSVKNLNDYISITQELNHKYKNSKISLNMSTVLSLKNIRSLEIEYFNKCHDNGAAFNIFGRMLDLPPSKTWSLLGKELVSMLQYWLDGVRKHLISHHPYWWLFLKTLLKFIKELSKKENSLNDTLVQELSDSLLDLATRGRTSVSQRHEILHTFNQYCAESGREVRLALRMEFDHYFVRLSTMMASCGHAPTQYSTLETLLRWLLPRRDPSLRQEAAARWLPDHLYANGVRQVFLKRPWMNFFQDARDLLNAHNSSSGHVTSVICRKLSIGKQVIVSSTEKRPTWLDLNRGSASLSILMDPKAMMDALDMRDCSGCEAIIISNDNTRAAKLYKESVQVMLSITTLEPPNLFPSYIDAFDSCDVTAELGGRGHIGAVDNALRTIFQDKYEVLMNIEDDTTVSPEKFENNHEDDTRFSHPAKEVGRRTRSGYTAWSRNPASWKSPSTASTSSLAQLHDKLAALPHYRFDKEPVSVCAQPKLSRLTELSESDDKQSFDNTNSTLKLGAYGVCHRSFLNNHLDKSQSDNEAKENIARNKASDEEPAKRRKSRSDSEEVRKSKNYSEIVEESLLLVATVGSADESVINDTLERLSTNKDYNGDNIVDLLVQEALQAKAGKEDDEKCLDSGINTGDGKKTQDLGETIKNTPAPEKTTPVLEVKKHNYTVLSKSTSTDESNTEAINDTPMCYVSVRKKNLQRKNSVGKILPTITEAQYYEKAVEDLFSQHFCDNNRGELLISPTLARKINETSTESSEFDECLIRNDEVNINIDQYEIRDIDIIECLNYMVDKVCKDFDKYLEEEKGDIVEDSEAILREGKEKKSLRDISNTEEQDKADTKNSKPVKKRGLKLKYKSNSVNKKTKSTQKKTKTKNKNKLELEPAEMSTVFENEDIHEEPKLASPKNTVNYSSPENKDMENRLTRRKRKLYSPKDDNIVATELTEFNVDVPIINDSVPPNKDNEEPKNRDNDDSPISEFKKRNSVTPKTTATSYKDIEKDRQRKRTIRAKKVASPDSPKTKKLNEVFDHLKDNIESNEKITLADKKVFDEDMAIFNFTSDSEDEDFKKKKVDVQKRISTTTINSGNSVISRRGRSRTKVYYSEKGKVSSDEAVKPPARKRGKRQNSKTKTPKALKVEKPISLVDERMRAAPPAKEGVLDTSIIVEKTKETDIVEEPVPAIAVPEIEFATEDEVNTKQICNAIEVNKKSKKTERAVKKQKANKEAGLEVVKEKDDDGTISPLPGLVVETVNNDRNYEDSLNSNFVQKVQKMYKSGADLDTNTTQNLLSDNEKTNHSLQINTTDEFNFILDNVEDNASFNVNAPDKEDVFVKKNYSEISPIKTVQDDRGMSEDKSVASSNNKRTKGNLRLKNSDTVNQSDSDAKYSMRSLKTTCKAIRIENKIEPSINNVSNLQNVSTKANSTEIICIEDESQNSKRSQAKLDKNLEIIEINDNVNSEESISTNCINAHGDLNEEPPSQKSLDQPLLPREIADMDESVLEYYVRLGKALENSRNCKSNETIDNSKENVAKKVTSPVLSLKRMSSEEIRKRIPPKSKIEDYDYRRWLPSRKDSESDNSKSNETIDNSKKNVAKKVASPILSLKRMSLEEIRKWTPPNSKKEDYDYRRWLPSRKYSGSDNNSVCSEKSLSVSVTRLSPKEIAKWTGKGANKILFDESDNNSSSENVNRSPLLKISSTNRNETTNERNKRKSMISPVKLFDDVVDIPKRKIRPKVFEEKHSNETSSKATQSEKAATPKAKRYLLRRFANETSSPDSNMSTSTRIEESRIQKAPIKRTLPKEEEVAEKRRKVEMETVTESGPSMSSVEGWLIKMETNTAGLLDASIGDTIQNIMERLNTTVDEIDHNSSKKFVNLYVDVQRQLSAQNTERREMCRRSDADILTEMASIIKEKRAELDRRLQEMDASFMENLMQRGMEFIKDDLKQKRAVVRLLKEDVQAVMDRVNKKSQK